MAAERTVMFQLPSVVSGTFACIAGTVAGRSWDLSAGTFVIGRNEGCDLQLPNEAGVSKVHAKIIAEGDRYVIVDCESRNGTIVNGVPVQKQALADGDEVRICGCVLRFTAQGGSAGPIKVRNIDQRAEVTDASAPAPSFVANNAATQVSGEASAARFSAEASASQFDVAAAPYPPSPAKGRVLAAWYAFGLVGSLVFGGTATAVVVFSAEPAQADGEDNVALVAPQAVAPKTGASKTDATDAPKTDANGANAGALAAADPAANAAPAPVDAAAEAAKAEAAKAAQGAEDAADDAAAKDTAKDAAKDAAKDPAGALAAKDAAKEEARDEPPAEVTKDEDEPAEPRARKRRVAATERAAPVEASSAPNEEAASPGKKAFKATADGGKSETLRTRGGKVRSVDVKDGEMVSKGQVLVTFDEGENGDEVATLRDRIASLEGAEDEDQKRELKAAKAKLDALQGGAKSAPIVAGMAGRLSGFTVGTGEVLKGGETVGRIVEGDAPRRVKVTVDRQTKPKRGQDATLVLRRGGEGVGSVLAISGRTVTVDTGDLDATEVESVRF